MTQDSKVLETLQQIAIDCPQLQGAVLATPDGLLLAATGCMNTEVAAASAAYLGEHIQENLSLISTANVTELMVWSQNLVWYLIRLPGRYVLMVCATTDCHAGALRLAVGATARRMMLSLHGTLLSSSNHTSVQ
jgi:predicted regulator of Ras-like GTPase activity (Roadblock/LC7/MglB family)